MLQKRAVRYATWVENEHRWNSACLWVRKVVNHKDHLRYLTAPFIILGFGFLPTSCPYETIPELVFQNQSPLPRRESASLCQWHKEKSKRGDAQHGKSIPPPKKNKNYPKKGRQVNEKRLIFVSNIWKEVWRPHRNHNIPWSIATRSVRLRRIISHLPAA